MREKGKLRINELEEFSLFFTGAKGSLEKKFRYVKSNEIYVGNGKLDSRIRSNTINSNGT